MPLVPFSKRLGFDVVGKRNSTEPALFVRSWTFHFRPERRLRTVITRAFVHVTSRVLNGHLQKLGDSRRNRFFRLHGDTTPASLQA